MSACISLPPYLHQRLRPGRAQVALEVERPPASSGACPGGGPRLRGDRGLEAHELTARSARPASAPHAVCREGEGAQPAREGGAGARDVGGASVGPPTWGKGIAGGRREAYTAEESAATRRAVGEGLTETCAEALESARERARARAESEEERRLERAKSRERHLETKRALREDDRAKRAREAEARVNASGTPTPKNSRRQKVDLSTRREEEEEEKTKGNDVDDESLVATGGFDFGD